MPVNFENKFSPGKYIRRGTKLYRKISSKYPFSYNPEGWEIDTELALKILKDYFQDDDIYESENLDGTFYVDNCLYGLHTQYDYWQYWMVFNPIGSWDDALEMVLDIIEYKGEKYFLSRVG